MLPVIHSRRFGLVAAGIFEELFTAQDTVPRSKSPWRIRQWCGRWRIFPSWRRLRWPCAPRHLGLGTARPVAGPLPGKLSGLQVHVVVAVRQQSVAHGSEHPWFITAEFVG